MRIDWYTKGVLTVIAALMGVISIRPYVSPDAVAHAQGSFAGVQYSGPNIFSFFDTKTGEIWSYTYNKDGASVIQKYRLPGLGAPMVKEK